MDFRPNQGRRRRRKKSTSPVVFLLPVGMLLGLFLFHTHTVNEIDRLNQEIEEFKQQGTEYATITRQYQDLQEREARINHTVQHVERLTAEDASYTDLIERLTLRLPGINSERQAYVRDMRLNEASRLTFDNADRNAGNQMIGVRLVGFSRNPDAVASLVKDFEADPAYETVLNKVARSGDEYEFTMELVALIDTTSEETP